MASPVSDLPPCDYRVETEQPNRFYCRHAKVHANGHLVSAEVCRHCSYAAVPCAHPRPWPSPEDLIPKSAPSMPSLVRQAWNLAQALAEFVADGLKTVSAEAYSERLAICEDCPERQGNRCRKCGCRLKLKAQGRAFECPLGKWPAQSQAPEDL